MAQSASPLRCTIFLTLTTCFLMTFRLVTTNAANASLATASNDLDTYCTRYQAWLSPSFAREDCLEAIERFQYSDYATYTTRRLEFSNRETQRTTRFPKITTPRRYTISTCTIFVAMLWDFPDQPPLPPLPGAASHPGPFEKSQVTSFKALFLTAKAIVLNCYGLPHTPVGWQPAGLGEKLNIGVFVMATDSLLAQNIAAVGYEEAATSYLQNLTQRRGFSTVLV